MLSAIAALLLQAVAASPVPPSPEVAGPEVVTAPEWVRRPSGDDFFKVYPRAAAAKDLSGRASISCQVVSAGTLADCVVIEEYPPDVGFGQAALRLASLFKMRPTTRNGQPVGGGTVRIPLRFHLAGRTDALTGMLQCYGATAVALESDPTNAELIRALAAFRAQVEILEVWAKATPETFGYALTYARREAIATAGTPASKATLKACLRAVRNPGT